MKNMKILSTLTAIGFAALFFACSKTGPEGAPGPAVNGTNGTNGINGNANIKDSIFTVTTWNTSAAYDYVIIADTQITAAIVDSGFVAAFWSINSGTNWDALNWTSQSPAGYTMEYNYSVGQVTFYFAGGGNPNTIFGISSSEFKVVCAKADDINLHHNTNKL
jgi:hypothetical protein